MNSHTFEVDLFLAGLSSEFAEAMNAAGTDPMKQRMQAWVTGSPDFANPGSVDVDRFLKDIDTVGKGRFAQRLACVIATSGTTSCPPYVLKGVEYVAERC